MGLPESDTEFQAHSAIFEEWYFIASEKPHRRLQTVHPGHWCLGKHVLSRRKTLQGFAHVYETDPLRLLAVKSSVRLF
jgi:hypothetical protein